MRFIFQFFFLLSNIFFLSYAIAQKVDSTYKGSAVGIIKDADDFHFLRAATISLYKIADSGLVSYQLTNNSGEFRFGTLPAGINLRIVVSHIGYKDFHQTFIISSDTKRVDFKTIMLTKNSIELNEVSITAYRPPVQMRGDTLEFNAEAFKLDRNAVVEDLLRKLPGITIWADGKITVNGKNVSKVYVDGKPFFGGNASIATQNLPKNVVDKIQVYSKRDEQKSPLDSIFNINIKLKKGNKKGLFGKIGAGYGISKRYSSDGMISVFSPKEQVSLVGASNNINLEAKDVSMLIRNSSFKGVAANIEYQPNFSLPGLNKATSGGFNFQHDFIPNATNDKNNRFDANYFINDNNIKIDRNSETTIDLNDDGKLTQNNLSTSNSFFNKQDFNSNYNLKNSKIEFYASQSLNLNKKHDYLQSTNTSESSSHGLQSTGTTLSDQTDQNQRFLFKTGLRSIPSHLKIDYSLNINVNKNKQINRTSFNSILNQAQNERFDRNYDSHVQELSNVIEFKFDNLKKLIFNKWDFFKIEMEVSNTLKLYNRHADRFVNDLDTITQKYNTNKYLTNVNKENIIDEVHGIKFARNFNKTFTNRFRKSVFANADINQQYYNQNSISENAIQNFNNKYYKFVPKASVSYLNDQFGDYQITYKLDYKTAVDYPTVNQIAPLVDSSNVYYLHQVNLNLKPSYKNEIEFGITYINYKTKNILNSYLITLKAGKTSNFITDSTIYDNLGRAVIYSVNAHGSKYLDFKGEFYKAYKFYTNQLQISANTSTMISRNPSYVNSILNESNTLFSQNSLSLFLNIKDFLALEAKESFSFFRSRQIGLGNEPLRNSISKTVFSISSKVLKKATLNSNVSYNRTSSSYSIDNKFTIWNASIDYRFLRGNQAEIKFSALDILHQNKSVSNYGSNNSLTVENVNVLQQYFMLSLSYFPRKFGKKEK